jgi:hypothetical protein
MPAGLAFHYRVDMLPTRRVKAYKSCSDKVVSVARNSPSRLARPCGLVMSMRPMSLARSRRRSKSTTAPIASTKGVWLCGGSNNSDRRAAVSREAEKRTGVGDRGN